MTLTIAYDNGTMVVNLDELFYPTKPDEETDSYFSVIHYSTHQRVKKIMKLLKDNLWRNEDQAEKLKAWASGEVARWEKYKQTSKENASFLKEGTPLFKKYLKEVKFCDKQLKLFYEVFEICKN